MILQKYIVNIKENYFTMSTISKSTTIAIATVAVAAATGATTHVSADAVASTAPAPTPSATTNSSAASTPESAYQEAQSSEASKLSDLKGSQAASETETAKSNATAESNAASSYATTESQVASSQATADSNAQSSAAASYVAQANNNSAAASSYASDQQTAKAVETEKQNQEATAFANAQAQETGSAQSQRDNATSEYNTDVQNQKDATAQSNAAVDQQASTAKAEAKTTQTTADATADATQATDTAKANSNATAAQNKQNTTYDAQVKAQTATNTASEVSAQKDVTHAQYNIDHPTATPATPADSVTNAYAAYDEGHTINRTGNLPISIQDPKIPASAVNDQYYSDFYGETGDADTTEAINGSATDAQQKELADYAITLINSVRQTHNLAPVTWSKNVEDATIASARAREAAGSGFTHTRYLTSSAKTKSEEAYASKGLTFALENMGMTSNSELTMLTAKAGILNSITAMVYQDGFHQNGHLENFLTPDLTMGFAIQKFNGGYILLFQGAYPASSYDAKDANNKNQQLTSTTLIEAARGGDTDANRQALDNAKAKLQSVQKENAQKLTDLANANADAKVAIQTQLENTISIINATHDAAIQANAKTYADTVANIEANAQKQHDDNASKLATTLSDMQTAYEAKIASIKDLTPEELASKKATELEAFQAKQSAEMQAFEAQQAKDAAQFQANLDNELAQFKSELDAQVAQEKAEGQTKLAQLKANNQKAYQALVVSNAQKLANLKEANAIAYAKAKAESDKYLESINPATQKPTDDNKGQNNGGTTNNGGNTNSSTNNHQSGSNSSSNKGQGSKTNTQTSTTSSNGSNGTVSGSTSNVSHMSYDPESKIFTPVYQANAETSDSVTPASETKANVTVDPAQIADSSKSSTKTPSTPETGVSKDSSMTGIVALALAGALSALTLRRKHSK